MKLSLADRFWAKVEKTEGCWLWNASLGSTGYGQINSGGRGKPLKAHRVSWELHYGQTQLQVLHRCDNTRCVNPSHLFLGTQSDNMKDMASKKRNPRGMDHWTKRGQWSRSGGRFTKGGWHEA
jgi:hypothetical protein